MSPEALPHLGRARRYLQQARRALAAQDWELAAFGAYTAGFYAAQVLVFERTGSVPKTHRGTKLELQRCAKFEPVLDGELANQFGFAETARNDAAYSWDPLPEEDAREALAWAERFVAEVERVLSA